MIDPETDDFDGYVDEAGNGRGSVVARNDMGEVSQVTEVISPNSWLAVYSSKQ